MNVRAFSILRLLKDGEFQSGVSLAKKLNCSRSTITNALKNIRSCGIEISKIRGRGFRWINPISYLNNDLILSCVLYKPNNFCLIICDVIDSTNNFLLKNFEKQHYNNNCIPVVATELQTHGRGRAGRSWHSGFGDSLTFSLGWRFEKGASSLSGLSLLIGIAIIRVFKSFSIGNVSLKWPNDILFDNKKLAGVLIELRGEIIGPSFVIIGIGINFKLSDYIKSSLKQIATDLFSITCVCFDRNLIFGSLLLELRNILPVFEEYGFSFFKNEWSSYHAYEGQPVSLIAPNGSVVEGTVDGVIDDGSICLITSTGRHTYQVGDISVRLNYH